MCGISWCRLVGIPDVKHFDDLLGKTGTAKKGAMKTAAAASRAGTIRRVTTKHMGDGQQLSFNLQVRTLSAASRPCPSIC